VITDKNAAEMWLIVCESNHSYFCCFVCGFIIVSFYILVCCWKVLSNGYVFAASG